MRRAGHLLAIATLATLGCRPPADAREARDFERMRLQPRYDTYETSRFFANGAVLQPPPAHTIPRAAAYAPATASLPPVFFSGRVDTTYVRDDPLPSDARLLALGARQYAISCSPCHGDGGFGGGPIAPNLVVRRPPPLRSGTIAALPAGMLFSVITNGFGVMPPYGWQMMPETRWAVVAYVRALTSQPPTTSTRADSARADAMRRLDSLRAVGASLQQIAKQTSLP